MAEGEQRRGYGRRMAASLPPADDPSLLGRFAARLREVGYSEAGLRRVLGDPIRLGVRGLIEVAGRRLDGEDPLLTVCRLFWLGSAVGRREAERAFAPVDVRDLERAGLVMVGGDALKPVVAITPYGSLFCAHDPGRLISEQPRDFVASVSASSSLFDWLTVRRSVGRALDLGTGCGVQALLAARHAEHVTALDVNARAVRFARLNAVVNGVDNLDVRQGTWFEPVGDARFDLLLANLPFVISPDSALTYRDGGLPRDDVTRLVVSTAPDHLEPDGLAQLFCNWVVERGGDWRAPVETWIDGLGCDAVLVLHGRHDPLSYAARWNHPLDEEDPPAFAATLDRWLAYYRGEDIDEIADGMVILRRRRAGRNYVRALEVPNAPARPAGEHVQRLFSGYDVVRSLASPAEALDLAPTLPVDASVARSWTASGRAASAPRVRLDAGVGLTIATTPAMAEVLQGCDGSRTLASLAGDLAAARGDPQDSLADEIAREATRLVGLGVLVVRGA